MDTSPEDWMQQSRALINVRQHKQLAKPAPASINSRKQLSSFILFLSVVIFVNLCPFHSDLDLFNSGSYVSRHGQGARLDEAPLNLSEDASYLGVCMRFMRLMFTNPVDFSKRSLKVYQADARVIGKMAKMWYIKKKIKKLSKKLKKHTIAVPVFTAIPIYEHSY